MRTDKWQSPTNENLAHNRRPVRTLERPRHVCGLEFYVGESFDKLLTGSALAVASGVR